MGTATKGGGAADSYSPEGARATINALLKKAGFYLLLLKICFPVLAAAQIALLIAMGGQAFTFLLFFLLAVLALLLLSNKAYGNLNKYVKSYLIPDALSGVFEVDSYVYNGCFAKKQIEEAGLISGWNACSGSDLIKGRYRGAPFMFSNVRLSDDDTDNDGGSSSTTVFKGYWIDLGLAMPPEPERFIGHAAAADSAAGTKTSFSFVGGSARVAVGSGRTLFDIGKIKKYEDVEQARSKVLADARQITATLDALMQNE